MTDASKTISKKSPYNQGYGYGYGYGLNQVRIPQLGLVDIVWIAALAFLGNIYMIITLFKYYLNNEDYSHAILVPVIAAAAAWKIMGNLNKKDKPKIVGEFWGIPILLFGQAIQFFAMWYKIGLVAGGVFAEYITSVGIIIMVWGLFITFFGFRALKTFWFPLLYLIFLIPGLPGPPEAMLKNALRNTVTAWSAGALELMGFSVYVSRNVIEIPGVLLGVADACSGIRSLWAMLAVAPAIAWFLRLRPFLIALFLPLGVFLAIFQNFIRVVATALLCHWFDMSWAEGTKHDVVGGISFFIAAMIMVVLSRFLAPPPQGKDSFGDVGNYGVYGHYGNSGSYGTYGTYGAYHAANDSEEEQEVVSATAEEQREIYFSRISKVRLSVFICLAALFILQLMVFQRYSVRSRIQYILSQNRMSLDEFPGQVGPFNRIYWGELPEQAMRILRPSESYVAWYSAPNGQLVNVIINFWEPVLGFHGSTWSFPHSPDVCFREAGWQEIAQPPLPADMTFEHEIVYSRLYENATLGNRQMVLYWYNQDFVSIMMNQQIAENVQRGTWGSYTARLRHVLASWRSPKEYSRFQYSVGIYVQEQGTTEETIELAQQFARYLREKLPPFGLKPLQTMDLQDPTRTFTGTPLPQGEPILLESF
jgi:exosortase